MCIQGVCVTPAPLLACSTGPAGDAASLWCSEQGTQCVHGVYTWICGWYVLFFLCMVQQDTPRASLDCVIFHRPASSPRSGPRLTCVWLWQSSRAPPPGPCSLHPGLPGPCSLHPGVPRPLSPVPRAPLGCLLHHPSPLWVPICDEIQPSRPLPSPSDCT